MNGGLRIDGRDQDAEVPSRRNRWWVRGLQASLFIAPMGLIFVWIGLFSAVSGFAGGAAAVAELTGFPLQRVVFALGALFCSAGAAYALSCFVRALRA